MPLPQGSPDRKPHGLLTYTLYQVLTQAETPMTYTELVQRIQAQYVAWMYVTMLSKYAGSVSHGFGNVSSVT